MSEQLVKELKVLIERGRIEQAREFLLSRDELVGDEKYLLRAGLIFLWADCPSQALELAQLGKEKFPGNLRFRALLGMIFSRRLPGFF